MNSPEYYFGVLDIWVEATKPDSNIISLVAPDLNVNISMPIDRLRSQKMSAIVPAFKRRDGGRNFICAPDLLGLLKQLQKEPEVLAKIIAVSEAYTALEGGK